MTEIAKIESKYERLRKIGIGSYGVVFKCVNRQSGQIVAIKRYSENDTDPIIRKIAMREVRMLRQLKHPNLIQLIEVFRRKRRLHLVFDYCELTVLDVIEKYTSNCPLNLIKKIIWQLVNGVSYCHSHNCIHRDIKPENILINQHGVVKLCDFGFARNLIAVGSNQQQSSSSAYGLLYNNSNNRQLQPEQEAARLLGIAYNNTNSSGQTNGKSSSSTSSDVAGGKENSNVAGERLALTEYVATRWYRAPELLVGEVYYDTKIDIWAIGCVTAELMRGEPVWPGKTDLDQLFMIKNSLGPLTAGQTRTLVSQNLYDQASIERLIDNGQAPGRPGEVGPLESRLPSRVGQAGIEFVLVCLQIDPEKRPTSEKLLRHPYIHSARMAQFVKGSGGTESTATFSSAKAAPHATDDFSGRQQSVRRLSKQQNRSNSEALILAANNNGNNLSISNQQQQQMMMMAMQQQQRRNSHTSATGDAAKSNRRQPLDPIADRQVSFASTNMAEERAIMNCSDNQKQHKRKKPPTQTNANKPAKNVAGEAATRQSLVPISSSRLKLHQTGQATTTNGRERSVLVALNGQQQQQATRHTNQQRQQQQQLTHLPAPSDSASSSSLSVTSGLTFDSSRLSQSNGNQFRAKLANHDEERQRQSTSNINAYRQQRFVRAEAGAVAKQQQPESPMRQAKSRGFNAGQSPQAIGRSTLPPDYSTQTPTRLYGKNNNNRQAMATSTKRNTGQQQPLNSSASSSSNGQAALGSRLPTPQKGSLYALR